MSSQEEGEGEDEQREVVRIWISPVQLGQAGVVAGGWNKSVQMEGNVMVRSRN